MEMQIVSDEFISTNTLSKSTVDSINCYKYINTKVTDRQFEWLDKLAQKSITGFQVYSTKYKAPNGARNVKFDLVMPNGQKLHVDWRIYRTWANTYHLRHPEAFKMIGVQPAKHVHPDVKTKVIEATKHCAPTPFSEVLEQLAQNNLELCK